MLFRSARSLSDSCAWDRAGNRTSREETGPEALAKADASPARGVGNLLVAGVEYSPSDDSSCGVGTDEPEVLPIAEALPRRGFASLRGAGEEAAELALLARREARDGLPRGLLTASGESPETTISSSMVGRDDADLVGRTALIPDVSVPSVRRGSGSKCGLMTTYHEGQKEQNGVREAL